MANAQPQYAVLPFGQLLKYGTFNGTVAANNTITINLPLGSTYIAIYARVLDGSGVETSVANMKSSLGNVKLTVDGEDITNATATELLDIDFYDTLASRAGMLPVYRTFTDARDVASMDKLSLGTRDNKTGQIQIVLGGTLTSVSSVELWAIQTQVQRPQGAHIRLLKYPRSFSGTGEVQVSDLPRIPGSLLLDLHLNTATNVSYAAMRINGFVTHNNVPVSVMQRNADISGKVPQTGYYHFELATFQTAANGLPMDGVNDFAVTPNFTVSPTSFDVIMRSIYNFAAQNA